MRPDDLKSIERAFFGTDRASDADRNLLRAAFERAASRNKADPTLQILVAPPDRCLGRETEAAELSQALLTANAVAVVGPPGVGKTTLVRQVANDPAIIRRFGPRRWYVDLEAAPDAAALRTAILVALGRDPARVDFHEAIARLGRKNCLIVLDHLEAPWERDLEAVEACLRELAAVPALKMAVCLRGTMPPARPHFELVMDVGPLRPATAKELFLELAPRISPDDCHLRPLLEALHGNSLAIELVAFNAAPFRSLQSTWEAWQRFGLNIAAHPDQAAGRYTSVWSSIELSWQSPRLRGEGRTLFRMLGELPGGMEASDVAVLMKDEAHEAKRQLLATGLAFEPGAVRVNLIPTVRTFARAVEPLEPPEAAKLANHYLRRGAGLVSGIGTAGSRLVEGQLKYEVENIEKALIIAGQIKQARIASDLLTDPVATRALGGQIRAVSAAARALGALAYGALAAADASDAEARSARERSDLERSAAAEKQADMSRRRALLLRRDALSMLMPLISE